MYLGLPWWLDGKESVRQAGDMSMIPGSGRFAGRRHGNPFSILAWENPMDRGAWQATIHGTAKSWT